MRALQIEMDRRPVGLGVAARAQVRRLRRALEHRPRQRRVGQRACLRPRQPRRRMGAKRILRHQLLGDLTRKTAFESALLINSSEFAAFGFDVLRQFPCLACNISLLRIRL